MSQYDLCFLEGSAGRCGFECRAFAAGQCQNSDTMIFDYTITYEQFLDCQEIYDIEGTEMKRINDLIVKKAAHLAMVIKVLTAINSANWDNLAVDEVVCVNDNFEEFLKGVVYLKHFSSVKEEKFLVFYDGKSSKTTTRNDFEKWTFALPKADYDKLFG